MNNGSHAAPEFAEMASQTTVPDETTLTLFDIAGLPDRLVPPMILQIVDHIEGAIQRTRSLRLQGEVSDGGAWAGRAVGRLCR